jgi:putative cell wall-binding protein
LVEFGTGSYPGYPVDVVAGGDGSVWVAVWADQKIVRLDRSGAVAGAVFLAGAPTSLASDGEGGVWASETEANMIAHVTMAGTLTEIPLPTPNSTPTQIYDAGDFVFVAELTTGHLGRLTESTGHLDELPFTGVTSPMAVSGIGDQVWVVDRGGQTWLLDGDGENPESIDLPPARDIDLVSLQNGTTRGVATIGESVFEFTRSGTDLNDKPIVSGRRRLTGVAVQGDTLWFADAGSNSIGWAAGSNHGEYPLPTADSALAGMAITEGRYIWSAESHTGRILRFDTKIPDVDRIGGADRYELAVNVSKAGDFSGGDGTVFVVSGETFADALSAGPIAAAHTAPILLTARAALPDSTRGELVRLAPQRVVVVGGPASVTPAVFDSIKATLPGATVDRIGGVDRYAVSRSLLASDLVHDNSPTLYVANGQNFPDALSSTAAAVHLDSATLLVNGAVASLSAEEMKVIGKFTGAGKSVKIAGGPNSVSAGIEAQIRGVATVQRLGGADRYEVSQAIVRDAFGGPAPSLIYLASGVSFPDALAGGVGAGLNDSPVLLVHPDCVPQPVLDLIASGNTRKVTLYGGPLTLNGEVEKLTACR